MISYTLLTYLRQRLTLKGNHEFGLVFELREEKKKETISRFHVLMSFLRVSSVL